MGEAADFKGLTRINLQAPSLGLFFSQHTAGVKCPAIVSPRKLRPELYRHMAKNLSLSVAPA
jgi:hypothetical protein